MTELAATRSLIVEREMPHPPEKVWRALTQGALLEEWLMRSDFAPSVGRRFNFRAEPTPYWDGVVECEVLLVQPPSLLSYSWNAAGGLRTVVTWTLMPTKSGVLLRLEQSGFAPGEERNYQGAVYGWQRNLANLERVVGTLAEEDGPAASEVKAIVVERLIPHPPERVWRALTNAQLIAEWLMQNDFLCQEGHRFTFRATPLPGWSGVTNCVVLAIEPMRRLVYSWGDGTESDSGLRTLVTWTLTPEGAGSRVRMEQSGFRPQDEAGYRGMGGGWPRILERLQEVAAGLAAI